MPLGQVALFEIAILVMTLPLIQTHSLDLALRREDVNKRPTS
jgi:hypothetical protein